MQTRRRLHQTDQQDYSSSSTYTIQEDQQGGAGAGSVGTGTAGGSVGLLAQSLVPPPTGHEAAIHIGDNYQSGDSISTPDYSDDKYGKAARQWNLRAFSGHALRTLSAAAAVVTGNQPGINNDSQSNYSYPASIPTSSQFYQSKEEPQETEPVSQGPMVRMWSMPSSQTPLKTVTARSRLTSGFNALFKS